MTKSPTKHLLLLLGLLTSFFYIPVWVYGQGAESSNVLKKWSALPWFSFEKDRGESTLKLLPDQFQQEFGPESFRQAQMGFHAKVRLDPDSLLYQYSHPILPQWGGLPYPPLNTAPTERAVLFKQKTFHMAPNPWGREWTRNSRLDLLQNGESETALITVAQGAKQFLFLHFLSVTCDSSTEPFLLQLERAAGSGVDVRLLVNKNFAFLDLPCLRRLEQNHVQMRKVLTHSSYIVNDQSQLLIGAQSIARFFFRSNGRNFLDRDLMVFAEGPLATDALGDFLHVWAEAGAPNEELKKPLDFYLQKQAAERIAGRRREKPEEDGRGECRFAQEFPRGQRTEISDLLVENVKGAKRSVFFSGVKVEKENPAVLAAMKRSKEGVRVDYLGNGFYGGNGELTMWLDELVAKKNFFSSFFSWVREWDRRRQIHVHRKSYLELEKESRLQVWNFFQFVHYKAWQFDDRLLWIGSSNPDFDGHNRFFESGVLCADPALNQHFQRSKALDLANAVPISLQPQK